MLGLHNAGERRLLIRFTISKRGLLCNQHLTYLQMSLQLQDRGFIYRSPFHKHSCRDIPSIKQTLLHPTQLQILLSHPRAPQIFDRLFELRVAVAQHKNDATVPSFFLQASCAIFLPVGHDWPNRCSSSRVYQRQGNISGRADWHARRCQTAVKGRWENWGGGGRGRDGVDCDVVAQRDGTE